MSERSTGPNRRPAHGKKKNPTVIQTGGRLAENNSLGKKKSPWGLVTELAENDPTAWLGRK